MAAGMNARESSVLGVDLTLKASNIVDPFAGSNTKKCLGGVDAGGEPCTKIAGDTMGVILKLVVLPKANKTVLLGLDRSKVDGLTDYCQYIKIRDV